jgi:hypothetical protein
MARVYLILLILLLPTCLKKQDWKVEPPVWPRYVVEGWVYDSATGFPIESVVVQLTAIRILFPDSIDQDTVTYTNVLGYFVFPSVPALMGELHFRRWGYQEYTKRIVIQRDRSFDIYLTPARP